MDGDKNRNVALLILANEQRIFPVTLNAFKGAQSARSDLKRYIGSMVVFPNGETRKISEITVLGAWGESLARKLVSILTSAWKIEVKFSEPVDMGADQLRELVVAYLKSEREAGLESALVPEGATLEDVIGRISKSKNVVELLAALQLPGPEDCLDVL